MRFSGGGSTSSDILSTKMLLQIIPAENLVATFQSLSCDLFAVARTFLDARVMFEALEVGMDGVLLRTEDPLEVCSPRVIEKKVANCIIYVVPIHPLFNQLWDSVAIVLKWKRHATCTFLCSAVFHDS